MILSNRKNLLSALVIGVSVLVSSCNSPVRQSRTPILTGYELPSHVSIRLKGNQASASTVYHIDHMRGRIYNSSYLPYNTELDSASMQIIMSSNIQVKLRNLTTGAVTDWTTHLNDSMIDVTGGKLQLEMQLRDKVTKTYDLRIMSYGYNPNKLTWVRTSGELPRAYSDLKVVSMQEPQATTYYLIGQADGSVDLMRVSSYEPLEYQVVESDIPADLSPASIVQTGERSMWAISEGGTLYYSQDLRLWSRIHTGSVACRMLLFAPLKGDTTDEIVLVGEEAGQQSFYVANAADRLTKYGDLPQGFPSSGAYTHVYRVGSMRYAIVLGGMSSQGLPVQDSYFTADGINWAPSPYNDGAHLPISGALYMTSPDHSHLYVIGGINPTQGAEPLRVSRDYGLTWTALSKEQVPGSDFRDRTNAAGVILDTPDGEVMYILGGTVNSGPIREIWRASVDKTGGIINAYE